MPRKNTDHVIVVTTTQNSGHLKCNYCAAELPYQLPMSVDAWVKMMNKFTKSHASCKPADKLVPGEFMVITRSEVNNPPDWMKDGEKYLVMSASSQKNAIDG